MDPQKIIEVLSDFQNELMDSVVSAYTSRGREFGNERYDKWKRRFTRFLDENLLGESNRLSSKLTKFVGYSLRGETEAQKFWREDGEIINAFIDSLKEDFEHGLYEAPKISDLKNDNRTLDKNHEAVLERIFSRFHAVARALRRRHNGRNTLDVNDEYDVQDLLKALLLIGFDDVRAEEWTPSYAGQCSRMDFLLKNEQTVIEVKMTRNGLADKDVGNQLIIDIQRYKNHPDCKKLICFVYDPEGRIINPAAIENDLASQSRDDLRVHVFIYPRQAPNTALHLTAYSLRSYVAPASGGR